MDRPISVAIFVPTLQIGGAERVVVDLANGLSAIGWNVQILTMLEEQGGFCAEVSSDVTLRPLGAANYRSAIKLLARFYDTQKPDVVLATLYINDIVAIVAKFLSSHKPKIIVGGHNSLRFKIRNPDNRKDRYLLYPLCRGLFRFADMTIGVSLGVADELRTMLKLSPHKVRVVYNPVTRPELTRLAAQDPDHRWLRVKDLSHPVVISVGRLVAQKGLFDLLKAFQLVRNNISARLIIVGDGPLKSELEDLAAKLGISSCVDFVGFQPNPYQYLSRSDLFVLSSKWEGLAIVVIEALAVGCPVVATNCDFGPREILLGEKFGLLAPTGDPESLADKMLKLLSEAGTERKSPACLKERAAHFSLENAVEGYREAITSLVCGSSQETGEPIGAPPSR